MASPVFIANTSAAPISLEDEMPASSNKDWRSLSVRVSTSLWMRADESPPLIMLRIGCISEHLVFTVFAQAAEVCCLALVSCMNVIG